MAANNQVVLIGRVGNNVSEDVRHLKSGSSVAEVRIAVNRPTKDEAGNNITDWITCQFWNKQSETLAEYVKKGDLISVTGAIRIDNWETPEGEKRSKMFIHGENFQMLESKRAREERHESGFSMPTESRSSYQQSSRPAAAPVAKKAAPPPPADDFANDDYALDDDELPPF